MISKLYLNLKVVMFATVRFGFLSYLRCVMGTIFVTYAIDVGRAPPPDRPKLIVALQNFNRSLLLRALAVSGLDRRLLAYAWPGRNAAGAVRAWILASEW